MYTINDFLKTILKYSTRDALVDDRGSFTYKELINFSYLIASNLINKGIKKGDRVVIDLDKTKEYIACFIAVLLIGGVAIPLNISYPQERKNFIKKDSNSKLTIDKDFLLDLDSNLTFNSKEIDEKDESFIIYTSGSTGNPKGVIHSHISAFSMIFSDVDFFNENFKEKENYIYHYGCLSPFSFIASWQYIFLHLLLGNLICIVNDDVSKDVNELCSYFEAHNIDTAFIPPRMLNFVLSKYEKLKVVYTGSEKLNRVYSSSTKIVNIYGSSESMASVCRFIVDKEYDRTPIGYFNPILNGYILDENNNEVEEGELCISGNLFLGYNNLLEQTKKVITLNPFSDKDGFDYLYHSGDLCKNDEKGRIVLINRKDWMIKINGLRVEPFEIEQVLKNIKGIKDGAVKDFTSSSGVTFIVGYYVCDEDINEDAIYKELKKKLPDYMIPSYLVKLDKLPINNNGKLDRKSLEMPDVASYKKEYIEPINDLERQLAKGFQEVLNVDKVSRKDDFFSLGGDSIKSMELQVYLNNENLSSNVIYKGRTVEGIALLISDNSKEYDYKHTDKEKSKLSSSQLGVYLDFIKDINSLKYNNPFIIKLDDSINIDKLKIAIETSINNHEASRCVIDDSSGIPLLVKTDINFKSEIIEKESSFPIKNLVKPFDIKNGPLYRVNIIKTNHVNYLFFDAHHLVFDGTSLNVLLNEISISYSNKNIEKEKISIFDIYDYEEAIESSQEYKDAESFFDSELSNNECQNNFPLDYDSEINVAEEINKNSDGLIDFNNIEKFVKSRGITENTLFLSTFFYTLSKFNGDDKAFVCVGESGRNSIKLSSTCGMLVKNIPLNIEMKDFIKVDDLLYHVEEIFRKSINNDIYPFYKLANKYGINNDFSFVYQNDKFNYLKLDNKDYHLEKIKVYSAISKLQLMVFKEKKNYLFNFTYRSDLYDSSIIESFSETYIQILKEFISKESLLDVSIMPPNQIKELEKINNRDVDYDHVDMVTMYMRSLEKYPNNILISYKEKSYTYLEGNKIINKIANYILSLKLGEKGIAGILIPRNEYMLLASLGVLKAGYCMQPLDSSYPQDRLNFMVMDSNAKILITTKQLAPLMNEYKGNILYLEDVNLLDDDSEPKVNIDPSDPFVMLYTSGTTGKPKGVVLEHRNFVSLFNYDVKISEIDSKSRIACYASYGFDASIRDLFISVFAGATSYIVPEEVRLDLDVLGKFYIDNQITNGVITTQVGRKFYQSCNSKYMKSLMVGGEKLVPIFKEDTFKIINGYGPTETTAFITSFVVDKLYKRVPIGRVNENNKCYVVDKNFNLVPFGVPGELVIAGEQVARGYHNREDITKKVFIDNPFSKDLKYKRMYRSGDVVRLLLNGNFDFIGRNDGQVKIRGFRVELSEVEKIIREFKDIKDATVVDFDKASGGKFIAAYIVSEKPINIEDLKGFILKNKPSYMVPEVFMQIDKIPLNQNSKVNKKALPTPIFNKKAEKNNDSKTDSYIVSKLRIILKDIILDDSVSYEDSLFDYGLTSISLMELVSKIKKEFNVSLSIKDLLDNCTLKNIEDTIVISLMNRENPVNKEHVKLSEYPLSETQNGIYVEYIKDVKSLNYNIPIYRIFKKEIYPQMDVNKLINAIKKVFEAHKVLKSTIITNSTNQIVMIPHDNDEVKIDIIKGSNEELEEYKKSFVQPFNLDESCYRITIFESDDIYLFMDVHHILYDGSSTTIFMNDLDKAINEEELINEEYSIFDFNLDEKKRLNSDEFSKSKLYYESLLADLDGSTSIIEECYISESKKEEIEIISSDIDLNSLSRFIKERGLSYNAFFLGAFGLFVNKFTYNETSCFTTIYNGRKDDKENSAIGMFVKTLPFVSSIVNNPSIDDYLQNVKNQILNNMANDIYSFAEISKEFNINTDLMFIYQGVFKENDIHYLPLGNVKSPMSIELRNDDGKLYFRIEYDSGKYSLDFIKRIIKSYQIVCKSLINAANVNDISLIDDFDKSEILNLNDSDFVVDETPIIEKIDKTLKRNPNKIAVVCENDSLTYKQLDELSLNVASYISSLGIKNEDVVSIMVPRSIYMVLMPIAVLRSGAGYQPLDQSYPRDRLNFMIKDSGAKLLIISRLLRDLVNEYEGPILYIEDINNLKPTKSLEIIHNPHDKFIMLYTSGTTGVPKGVILENINLSSLTSYYINKRNCDENIIMSSYASFGFDACLLDFYPTLICGGTIHIFSEDIRLNFPKIVEYIENNKITSGHFTTQVGRQIATTCKSKYLKFIAMGGEKLVPFDPSNVPFDVFNQYGPSECTSFSNEARVDKLYKRIPVGKPNGSLKVYIVDKNLNLLPIGATGELLIAGMQVGRGYLNREDKTAQVFIKNPFLNDEKYIKAYRTGDVCRMLNDGSIDFIGRNDGQVKVRGFRIELSEVEEIIRRYKDIKDVTTNAYDDPSGGKYIAAFIVSDKKIDIEDLNNFIRSEKPAYIVPKVTMQIDKIPLNVNSKVDKKKLPVPDLSSLQNEYVKPANELEKEFCDLFAQILGLNKVGATDDFFALGGSSIGAAQIVGHAFTKGYDIVFKNVFENSTPRALCEFIASTNKLNLEPIEEGNKEYKEIIEPEFKENVIPNLGDIKKDPLDGVVLLGATGFLGMHVLKELLDNTDEKVICVIRENDINTPLDRLLIMLEYYFENTYENLLNSRLFVIKGDLLDEDLGDKLKQFEYKTIINCAASVKHFAKDDSIQKTNAGGVANLVNIALKNNKKLIHISTLSVAGESVNNRIPEGFKMKETMLNIGQALDNKYIKSKFDAETEIKEGMEKGLKAKIIRVGNLMSRHSDGEFQINFYSNNFMNTFRAFQIMECIPYDNLIQGIEFSQIDLVAQAIVMLSQVEDRFNVFHVNNIHSIQMNNVVEEMNRNNIKIDRVSNETFFNRLNEVIKNTKDTQTMNSLLAYKSNKNEKRFFINTDNSFTLEVLYRLGFVWPLPDSEYLTKLINSLIDLDFFERKE